MGHIPQAGKRQKEMKESIEEIKEILNKKVYTDGREELRDKMRREMQSIIPEEVIFSRKLSPIQGPDSSINEYGLRVKDITMPYISVPPVGETQRVMSQVKEAPEELQFKKPPVKAMCNVILGADFQSVTLSHKVPDKSTSVINGRDVILHLVGEEGMGWRYYFTTPERGMEGLVHSDNLRGTSITVRWNPEIQRIEPDKSYNELYGDGSKKDFIKKQNEDLNIFDAIRGLVSCYYALKELNKQIRSKEPKVKWVYWKEGGETFSLLEEYIPAGQ